MHLDHERVRDLFANIMVERDPEELVRLTARLDATLTLHLEVEESVLYPTLLEAVESYEERTLIFGAQEDHKLIITALASIVAAPPQDERFHGRVHALHKLWNHHVDEEEMALFQLARRNMHLNEVSSLTDRMKKRREELESKMPAAL